jgi:hypothetical protein
VLSQEPAPCSNFPSFNLSPESGMFLKMFQVYLKCGVAIESRMECLASLGLKVEEASWGSPLRFRGLCQRLSVIWNSGLFGIRLMTIIERLFA